MYYAVIRAVLTDFINRSFIIIHFVLGGHFAYQLHGRTGDGYGEMTLFFMPLHPIPGKGINPLSALFYYFAGDITDVKRLGILNGTGVNIHHLLKVMVIIADALVPPGKCRFYFTVPFMHIDQLVFDHLSEHLAYEAFTGNRAVHIEECRLLFHGNTSFSYL